MSDKPTVIEQIEHAQNYIANNNINLDTAIPALRSMHPQLDYPKARHTLVLMVASILQLNPPFETEALARQICGNSGAYPFDGPLPRSVPFTLDHYQTRWREMANEDILIGRLLGIIPQEGTMGY